MKLRVLIVFLCSLATFHLRAQCTPNFNDTAMAPCGVVQFTNLSTSSSSFVTYSWSFPGGSPATSSLTNPTATYAANGTYTVCLTMNGSFPTCSASICQTISVNCFSPTCAASFNTLSCNNGQMSFTNTSSGTNGTTVYNWNFGNNTTSAVSSPVATYTQNGVYTVCMSYTTNTPFCTDSICQTVTVNCVPSPTTCNANFISSTCAVSGTNAQMSFTSTSIGTNSTTNYTWTAGSGVISNSPTAIATFTANGIYTVCLTISDTNSVPSCSSTICKTVNINCVPTPTCQANFTNTSCSNGQMTFYSTSTGTLGNGNTTYIWNNTPPPSGPPAPYTAVICLTITNHGTSPTNTCTSRICKSVLIDCTGIGFQEFVVEKSELKLFPNPNDGLFTINIADVSLSSSIIELKVYNVLGELVHRSTKDIYSGEKYKEINLQNLANGAYYLRLGSGSHTYSTKLVITK